MSQNIVMVFDTETSGLPPKELHKQLDKLPTIVQLSFVLFDINEKKIIKTYNKYIKQPEATDFNSQAFKITKITKSMCDDGQPGCVTVTSARANAACFYTYSHEQRPQYTMHVNTPSGIP